MARWVSLGSIFVQRQNHNVAGDEAVDNVAAILQRVERAHHGALALGAAIAACAGAGS